MKVFCYVRIQLVFLLFLMIWMPSNSFARTVDGLVWSKMTFLEKISYIEGFYDGISFYELQILENTELQQMKGDKYLPYQLRFDQLVAAVDKFYEDYKDIYIEVSDALRIIYMEQTGVPLEKINEHKTLIKSARESLRQKKRK